MRSIFKGVFSAAYMLSPIIILGFVSAMALKGNDSEKWLQPETLNQVKDKKQVEHNKQGNNGAVYNILSPASYIFFCNLS